MRMDERKKKVLQAIIQDYVATAEPVGSRTIARKYKLGVSPATIRNEMADLEELGLIEQPRTSAGRIPSDRGYRYYVDCLMERQKLTEQEEVYIRQLYAQKIQVIEALIQRTGELLAEMTNLAALVAVPQWEKNTVRYIQLVPITREQALLVMITSTGNVDHRILFVPSIVSPKDLEDISRVLNDKLGGMSLDQVCKETFQEIYRELSREREVVKVILELLEEALQTEQDERIYFDGTLNILEQPEFKDIDRLKSLLAVFDEQTYLRNFLREAPSGLTIRIGGENNFANFNNCSVITASYYVADTVVGTIGLLGPTRMEYAKAVAILEATSRALSGSLTRLFRK
jgi:heat-inducible transcriptional repressor